MKKLITVASMGVLLAAAVVAVAQPGRADDPQKKHGLFLEAGIFHDDDPNTVDQPFTSYVVWDGNDFVVVGSFNTLDPSLALESFWEYSINADCDGNKRRVECHGDETVFYIGTPTPVITQGLDWSFTNIDDVNFAFISQDTTGPGGVNSITSEVTDEATCLAVLAKMRDLVSTSNVDLQGKVRLNNGICH